MRRCNAFVRGKACADLWHIPRNNALPSPWLHGVEVVVAAERFALALRKRATPPTILFILVITLVFASGMGFVREAERGHARSVDWADAARVAWTSLSPRYHAETGLIDAAAGFAYTSVWEIGSTIAATYAARELEYIDRAEYNERIRRLLTTLESVELVQNGAFNLFYATSSATAVDHQFQPATAKSWSALHHGRLLLWLRRLASDDEHREQATRVVARLSPDLLLRDGYLQSGSDGNRFQDGRIGYEQYAAVGFVAWEMPAQRAFNIQQHARPLYVEEQRLLADRRGEDLLTSEPFILLGLETGWDAQTAQLSRNLLRLQQLRHKQTGRLTAASADAIDREPYYAAFCIYCDKQVFPQKDGLAWLSTEAAFGWHALLPNAYTQQLISAVQPARDPSLGWSSGIFEESESVIEVRDLNTSALILESALYAATGKPIANDVIPKFASVPGGAMQAQVGPTMFAATASFIDSVAVILLVIVIALVLLYTLRHYLFTLNRLFGKQRHPYVDVREADWPTVTVAIPAHNEEQVITHVLSALMLCDYPEDRFEIMVVNDRSTDRTAELIDEMAAKHPGRLIAFHRNSGTPGKAAALKDALERVTSDIVLLFDADYLPGKGLIKQLVAPFFDPEIGAVMGRVVPINVEANLLTRLLDLERSGGYQVDQQARMNLGLVPQFGGTVGGLRRIALESVGGWREDSLTEDTDVTYRLLLRGWKTAYQNRSECYEEVPDSWPVRMRQITRWARGHNECMRRYAVSLAQNVGWTHWWQRLDGMMLLGVYAMSAVLVLGWVLVIGLFFSGISAAAWMFTILIVASYSALGNFAVFFEIAAAARLDGYRNRIRLLPFVFFSFVISVVSTARTVLPSHFTWRGKQLVWHKTERSRTTLPIIV